MGFQGGRALVTNAQLAEKVARVVRSEPASTTNPPSPGASADAAKPKHPMAEMLRDPDMKEVFRKQARDSVARGVKELVSTNLVQQLGLTKEQTVAHEEVGVVVLRERDLAVRVIDLEPRVRRHLPG